jgi:Mce-associated membrane protein
MRRRRIAGESGPAAPAAKKAPVTKVPSKRRPAKQAAAQPAPEKAAPQKIAPVVTRRTPAASSAPPVVKVPTRKSAPPVEAPTTKGADPRRSRPSRRDVLWLVPATLIAIASLVAGVLLVISPPGDDDSASALDASRRQASSAAASAAETIFSFRYDQLDDHLTASKALMTPAFAKDFDEIAPALTELAPQRQIVVQAAARESAAMPCGKECSSTKADVLVFVDQARLVGDSKEPTVFANRIKVSMVKDDGGWLVANIRAL